jgi:hypothetical protein
MTLVDRTLRRQLTAAMALAMALALLLSGTALAQTPSAVEVDTACEDAPESDFTDISGNTFEDLIECLAWYEITQGTGDGTTYSPLAGVRRWNMVVFLHRVAMFAEDQGVITLPAPSDQGFTDIGDLSQEAQDAINVMGEIGVVKGKTATTFSPFTNVRRDQMASFINRLQDELDAKFSTSTNFFNDVPSSNVHRANINGLASEGIVQGTGGKKYNPAGTVTRGQMSAFIMRHVQVSINDGVLDPKGPDDMEGDITLDQTSAMAGGQITGTVDDPATVDNISVTGCGFQNATVDLDENGDFTLNIGVATPPGDCELEFTILRSDGSSTTATLAFVITAPPTVETDAPDLLSATVNGDVVAYTFDEAANGAALTPADFRIYDAGGNSAEVPTTVEISGSDPAVVLADFDGTTPEAGDATIATIRNGAVEDAAGTQAHAAGAALDAQTAEAGRTNGPDLLRVFDVIVSGGNIVASFEFDEAIDPTLIDFGLFELHANDGIGDAGANSAFIGDSVEDVSANDTVVEIGFNSAPAGLAASAITRGAVGGDGDPTTGDTDPTTLPAAGDDAVIDEDGQVNVAQSEPRSGTPAYAGGAVADRTVLPDLVSVKVVGDDTVAFEFDEAVSDLPADVDATDFVLYDGQGNITPAALATDFEGSDTNANVLNVLFPAADLADAVGAYVFEAGATATSDGEFNLLHELPLQDLSFTAGRTQLPDLVAVDVSFDLFGDPTVAYTFDGDVPVADAAAGDFFLADSQGIIFTSTAVAQGDEDNIIEATFTPDQAATAVVGAAQDTSGTVGVAGDPLVSVFPEGDVGVSQSSTTP